MRKTLLRFFWGICHGGIITPIISYVIMLLVMLLFPSFAFHWIYIVSMTVVAIFIAMRTVILWDKERSFYLGVICSFLLFSIIFTGSALQACIQSISYHGVDQPNGRTNVQGWLTVQGMVDGFYIKQPQSGYYRGADITYHYSVKGKQYKFITHLQCAEDCQMSESKYSKGSFIKVTYDPQNPQKSFVIRLPEVISYEPISYSGGRT